MKKVIIFDWGGILAVPSRKKHTFDILAEKLGVSHDKVMQAFNNGFQDLRCGRLNVSQFWDNFLFDLRKEYDKKKLTKILFDERKLSKPAYNLLLKLKKKNKIYIFSNNIEEWHRYLVRKFKINLKGIPFIASYHLNCAKPELKAFRLFLKRIKKKAKECIFIDDKKGNVKIAQKLGFDAIYFENVRQLKSELRKRDIEF
ncbi:MAG: HAD-IA family hydrolase [Nanoarchaeota archaeon]|nr:HAD-IA family hydrolase [Nanoarchaeota archaeon]